MKKSIAYFLFLIIMYSCKDNNQQYYWIEPTLNGTIDSFVWIYEGFSTDSSKYIFNDKNLEKIVHYQNGEIQSVDSQYFFNDDIIFFGNFDLNDTLFSGYSNILMNKANIPIEQNSYYNGKVIHNIKSVYDKQLLKYRIRYYNSKSDTIFYEYNNNHQLIRSYKINGSSYTYKNYIVDDNGNWIYREVIGMDKNKLSSRKEERIYYYH